METQISEDVILDLMPLYLAQSASDDTRTVVEQFLANHPELAAKAGRSMKNGDGAVNRNEVSVLRRTRSALRQRDFNLAFAIACSVAPFTFWYGGAETHHRVWMMMRDLPSLGLAFGVAAVGFWFGYAIWERRTRATGL